MTMMSLIHRNIYIRMHNSQGSECRLEQLQYICITLVIKAAKTQKEHDRQAGRFRFTQLA